MEFIKIPRSLVADTSLGAKRVLVYSVISFACWNGNQIDDLVRACGFSVGNRHAGSAFQQIKSMVDDMKDRGYIDVSGQTLDTPDYFGLIFQDEYRLIFSGNKRNQINNSHYNPSSVLLVLAHIRCYMSHTHTGPQYYSDLLCRIADHVGLSTRCVSGCVRVLEDLDILHSEELPRYKDGNGHWHSNVRIFVNRHGRLSASNTYDWQKEIKRGINMILTSQLR